MSGLSFMYAYARWHYTDGISALIHNSVTIVSFIWRFFSIPTLLATLFSPWRRLQESYSGGFSIEGIENAAGTLVVNALMRLVGAFVRITFVVFGLLAMIFAVVIAIAGLLMWVLLPGFFGLVIGVIIGQLV